MSVTRTLLRLYPASVREHWGLMLETDAQSAGWRTWPNLVAAVVDMWLHPVIWPAESIRHRRHRAAAMALVVTVTIFVIGRAAAASDSTLTRHSHVWTLTDCALLMSCGAILILPLPRTGRQAVTTLLRKAATLVVPLSIAVGSLVFAWGVGRAELSSAQPWVATCFWLALAAAAVLASRIVWTTVGSVALTPPGPARLHLGFAVLITGGALASWITLSAAVRGGRFDPMSALTGACLLALTFTLVLTLNDLRRC
ncbi:MAG TPA: hypothetical protein VFI65_22585 [Streptosporangiaceae bacterium]|nr:hypothetical protein [Streptosporangiaceae bacterium]